MARAQIEFGESLMVIIIIVFLLVIGLVFYFNVSKGSVEKELNYREDIGAVVLSKRVLSMPEVACDAYQGGNCIDKLKLAALGDLIDKSSQSYDSMVSDYYEQLFEFSTIKLHYVETGQDELLYEEIPTGNYTASRQFIFTTIYDPVQERQEFAYLNVTRYKKEVRV